MSDKIQPHHLGRKAIPYVRQSTSHQVLQNRESSSLNTRCGIALWRSVGRRSKQLTMTSLARRRAAAPALASTEWLRRFVLARWAPCRRARYHASPQQPRLAAAHRNVLRRRYGADRSGDGLCSAEHGLELPAKQNNGETVYSQGSFAVAAVAAS